MVRRKSKDEPLKTITNASGVKEILTSETIKFLSGVTLLLTAIFMVLAFSSFFVTGAEDQSILEDPRPGELRNIGNGIQNYAGSWGAEISYYFMYRCFGIAAYFIPVFLVFASMKLMRAYKVRLWKWFLSLSILMIWFSVALSYFMPESILRNMAFPPGGLHGKNICMFLSSQIGTPGIFIILLAVAICYLVYLSSETILLIRKMLRPQAYISLPVRQKTFNSSQQDLVVKENKYTKQTEFVDSAPISIDLSDNKKETETQDEYIQEPLIEQAEHIPFVTANAAENGNKGPINKPSKVNEEEATELIIEQFRPEVNATKTSFTETNLPPYDPRKDLEYYRYPTLDLLKKYDDNGPSIDMEEQKANKERITTILHNFGVEISSIKATIGPTITLYEITPAQGVRISKIRNLEDDIALSLSALGIRIIAPIPGKGTIGIEVPNKNPHIVSMESILNSKKFQDSTFDLPIALGKTITNEVYMVDLAKMPHLLVAGATGQGKSVGLNAIITSLLYKKHPAELKFVMIDPKKVEFSIYNPIEKHFLAKIAGDDDEPIITDVYKVIKTLKSLCQEMDTRYDLLKKARVRNVKDYNHKFRLRQLNPENGHRFMPYIVVIIDEYGDLIMTAGKEVELPIARIAQLARAVGIHMVIATQRPTASIITGTIKANFPARMAFKVASMIDSRTILDRPGANQLVGRGDMLFLSGSDPVRVQCAFIDTPEVERINSFIVQQQGYLTAFELPEVEMENESDPLGNAGVDVKNLDPLFEEAARLIVIHQQGSTSLIQRKFAIGYNRAGRLMDQLERAGIVGPQQGAKPRDVLCCDESDLENKINNL